MKCLLIMITFVFISSLSFSRVNLCYMAEESMQQSQEKRRIAYKKNR